MENLGKQLRGRGVEGARIRMEVFGVGGLVK